MAVNQTGSAWEKYVDTFATYFEGKAESLDSYVKSDDGKKMMDTASTAAKFAIALLFCLEAPVAVVIGSGIGFVVQVFSPEQVTDMGKSIRSIWDNTPVHLRALGGAVALLYTPIVFPLAAGMLAGAEIGSRVSPHLKVAKEI